MDAARQSQTAALVALLRQPRARWQDIAAEVLAEGEAVGVLERTLGSSDTLFPDHDAMRTAHSDALDELRAWEQSGIAVHSLLDASYPARLRDIREMPPVVFTRGLQADDRRAVAVVGTRKPSDRGLSDAQAIATALAESGVTVVSGLASGIDTAAHTAALRAGGRTVAVVGTGVNRFYPAQNRELQQRIVQEGLVLSQFWPDASPTRQSFPMRNAVMSGYSAATVVVEAAYQSGARIQARLALQHGRPVVLAESLLQHDWAQSYASRPGVVVVSSKDQLIAAVNQIVEQIPNADDALEGLPRLADA
ncbi:DNA-protecting protein DprA [Actinoplanes sp. Pm04-4]|uniref:DNA-protecting protein DprA n=1 Tax=Paractinoplanes pyxinae TaxID=2997416 RepID=A0ABT4B7J8_9ACTN|nr:DNA-processing protein DprA [Actinoplanes pyxinae]MCY1141570.1 DNA-protecting protein DprA [Actinoplanes pyxinae]